MTIYENVTDFNIDEATAVALGKFDGDHIGHQRLFEELRDVAAANNLKTLVFTFSSVSPEIPQSVMTKLSLMSLEERRQTLKEEKIDYIIEYPFNPNVAAMEAEEFLSDVLIKRCNMKYIVGGPDISFGKNRRGNVDFLKDNAQAFGYGVSVIEKLKNDHGEDISSTMIKDLLIKGMFTEADLLLHRR